ncbi:hypothetical protein BGZ92_001449 [Podila epicladia]|nr:hypothetical protein BGZ92_001449 [Podila epicladia]
MTRRLSLIPAATYLSTLSGPSSHVDLNNDVIGPDNQASLGESSPSPIRDIGNHDRRTGDKSVGNYAGPSNNCVDITPPVPIALMPPGPGGPFIFDVDGPFDMSTIYTDKDTFD